MKMLFQNPLLKSFMGVGALRLMAIPLSLATSILIARVLGPENFGKYAFVMALVPVLALPVSAGNKQLLTREVAAYLQEARYGLYRGLAGASLAWVLFFSLIVITIFVVLSMSGRGFLSSERWELMSVAIFLIPLMGLNAIRDGFMKGMGKPFYSEVSSQIFQPSILLLILLVVFFRDDASGLTVVYAQLFSFFLAFLVATFIFVSVRPKVPKDKMVIKVRDWLYSLLPFSLIASLTLFGAQISILLLGLLSGDEEVAGLRIAEKGAQFVALSLTIVNLVISPHIVRKYRDKDREGLQRIIKKSTRGAFLLALPISLVLIVFGRWIISLLYGEAYESISYWPLVILVVGQVFNVFCGPVGNLLSMSGFEKLTLLGVVVGLLVNVIACLFLIPLYGAVGGALSSVLGLVFWNVTLVFLVLKKVGVNSLAV